MAARKRVRAWRSAAVFAALGDETRLRLLARLAREGPLSITELAAGSRVTRQAITKHLLRMERAGVLDVTKRGRARVYTVQPDALDEARRDLRAISDQWDAALGRLRRFLED